MIRHSFFAALLVIALLIGVVPQASALLVGDSLTLGLTPGEPSSPTDEANYINFLVSLTPGTVTSGPSSPPDYTRTTNVLCFPTCPSATTTGSVTDNSGNNGVNLGTGYTYLLAKYDGPNGGDVVWYVAGLTGIITIPTELAPNPLCTVGSCGLSHLALFNPTTPGGGAPGGKIPEPSALILLGSGLLVIGGIARKFQRKK